MASHSDESPVERLRHLVIAGRVTQGITVAATLGIADLPRDGPRTVEDLATAAGAHAPSLYRILRLLASEGIFAEGEGRHFELTPMAMPLLSDVPGSLRARAVYEGADFTWRAWGDLLHMVRTGEPAFEHIFGMPYFAYLTGYPEAAAVFNSHMAGETRLTAEAVAQDYDFSGVQTVVDVGGGRGALLIDILRMHPHLRGILIDQPPVVVEAAQFIEAAGVAARCETVGGDFFSAVPAGGDCYILKSILHDWDDESALRILRTCRRAMPPKSRLLVVEALIPPGNATGMGKSLDIIMLALVHGRERTELEYRDLLGQAGFRPGRVIPTGPYLHIMEAAIA